jgi:voltage-gated potassium channel
MLPVRITGVTMKASGTKPGPAFLRFYNPFVVLVLSLWVLVQLALEILLELSPAAVRALSILDLAICIVFIADWIVFFLLAEDRRKYAASRFIDLVSSVPFVAFLRPLRIFRIIRIIRAFRLLRGLRGVSAIMKTVAGNPARSALTTYLSATALVCFYCSLGRYWFERGANEKVRTFGDVLWMAFTTMTTVGYGDIYPSTTGGRLIAAVLVLTGMGLFCLLTAEIATLLLKRTRAAGAGEDKE